MTYFDLSVFENASQVLRDPVIRAKVLLGEVDCLFVTQNGRWVRTEELLLDTHVVIGNGEHGRSIFRGFRWQRGILLRILFEGTGVESLREHHLLEEDDGAHRVVECQLVLVQLRENGTDVQVSVCLDLGLLEARFDRESTLEEIQGGPHLPNTSVVASHIVEGHGLAELVVLAQLLRLLQ